MSKNATENLPLDGIRIVELTSAGAGPFGGMILSDLGAEVIKVEDSIRPDVGTRGPVELAPASMRGAIGAHYPDRQAGTRPYERYTMFNYLCRNRLSATFDLSRPSMHAMLLRLIDRSDVLLANRMAGVLEGMGLGYDVLSQRNERLVMVEATAFGSSQSPYRDYRGYGATMEAFAGHTLLRGYPDSEPSSTYTVVHADAVGGAHAAFAICAALVSREQTGHGTYIDLAQTEALIHQLGPAIMDFTMNGRVRETLGNRDTSIVQGVYRSASEDAWLAVSIEDDTQWVRLCGIIDRPLMALDDRFSTTTSRLRNIDEIDDAIESWSLAVDHYEAFHLLQDAGIPAAPILDMKEAMADPHHRERNFFEQVTYPYTGPIVDGVEGPGIHEYAGPFFDLSESNVRIRRAAPSVGQDNEYVFREIVGLDADEYAELVAGNHVVTGYGSRSN